MEWRQLTFGGGLLRLNMGMIEVAGVQITKGVLEPNGVSLWRTIRKGWPNFSKSIHFEVGVGNRVKF